MSKCEILLVDDEPAVLWMTGRVLEDQGYRVTMASSGEVAVEALDRKDFDLVITDLNMYQTDGITVLKKARVQNPEALVLLHTASDPVTISDTLPIGFDDYIAKPCRSDELLKQVADCLQKLEHKSDMRDKEGSGKDLVYPFPGRRRHPRYTIRRITSYSYVDKRFLTLTLDLGLGGMKIKSHCYLPNDEHLNFKLILKDNPIWPKGRVAYNGFLPNEESVLGIQFMDLSDQDSLSLQNHLVTLEGLPKPRGMLSAGERAGTEEASRKTAEELRRPKGERTCQRNHP